MKMRPELFLVALLLLGKLTLAQPSPSPAQTPPPTSPIPSSPSLPTPSPSSAPPSSSPTPIPLPPTPTSAPTGTEETFVFPDWGYGAAAGGGGLILVIILIVVFVKCRAHKPSAPDINTAAVSTTPAPVIEDKYFARKSDIISVVVDATTTSPRGRGPDGRMIRDMNPDTIPSPHNSPSPSPTPSPAVEPEHIPDGELDEAEVSRMDNDMDSSFVTYGRPVSETFTTSELDRLKDPSFVDEMALLEAEAEAENERRQGMKSEPIARPLNRQYRGGRGRGRGGGMEGGVGGGRGAPDSPGMMRRPASPPRNIPVLFGPIVTQDGAQQDPQSDPIRPISPSRFNNNRGPLPPRNIGRPSARPMSMPPKQGNELRARDLLSEPLQSRVKDRDTLLQSAGLDLSDQGGPKNGNKKSQHASMMLGKNPKKVSASAMFDIESESVDDRSPFQGLRDITRDLDRI